MAAWNVVLFAVLAFLAACSTAYSNDIRRIIQIPDNCKGKQYCSIKPVGYEKLEKKMNSVLPKYLRQEYNDRIGPDSESVIVQSPESDKHNCPYVTKRESMYLYNHGTNDSKTDIIVQTQLFRQQITTVSCAHDRIPAGDEECFQDLGLSAFKLKSTCVNTYAYRTLYVFDVEREKVIPKEYSFPVCCSCVVRNKSM